MAHTAQREDWKQKYRALLGELEAAQSVCLALDEMMRRVCARLAIAAMGRDQVVDHHLENIHRRVKRDGVKADVAAELDALAKTVVAHETRAADVESVDLSAFVASLPLPACSQKRHLDALEHQQESVRKKGLADLAAEITALLHAAPTRSGHQDVQRFVDALIEHTGLPPALRANILAIGARLEAQDKDASVEPVLLELGAAIGESLTAIGVEKEGFEAFIEDVTDQLTRFEAWAGSSVQDANDRAQDASVLERNVEAHLDGFQNDVGATQELSDLKSLVQTRLDNIGDQLRQFRARERSRAAQAKERQLLLSDQVNRLRERTRELARQCSDQQQKLMHDTLTGVHTRYAYDQRLQEEFQRWQRHGLPLSYSIWDIDHFKKVNDQFGHQTGDRLLAAVAALLARLTRSEDFVARIGGEEFVVLFPATTLSSAQALAQRVREALADSNFHFKGVPIPVTLSCGLTEFRDDDTPQSVYERADKALYKAKQTGRNRCEAD